MDFFKPIKSIAYMTIESKEERNISLFYNLIKILKLGHRGYGGKEKNDKTEKWGYP